jgi:chemotaxis protein histidine kinase CheA
LDSVQGAVDHYLRINEEKLGRKGRASDLLTTRGVFVGNDALAELRSMGKSLGRPLTDAQATKMRNAIDHLGLVPLNRIVSGSVDSISSLAHELQKPAPAVDLTDDDIAFNSSFAEALKSSLMHMVRNSLDHGIEAPAERVRASKPEQGQLRFVAHRGQDKIELHISDDGRGLPLHKLFAKGVAAGLFKESDQPPRQAVADLIFLAGLSTSNEVSQVSGRGVGMDAVRTFLEEQGASVRVALSGPDARLDFAPFQFIIDIPRTAYTHS